MNTKALQQALDNINPLSEEAWSAIVELVSVRTADAGQQLLRANDKASSVFFVQRGLLREYYLDSAGREATRRFCGEGELSGSLADLLSGNDATVSIETLLPCELIEFSWSAISDLSEQHPSLMKLLRRLAEGLYVRKMQREFQMLTLSAAERYAKFTHDNPELDARLPRHMVASYLGISAVHLSRICAGGKSEK